MPTTNEYVRTYGNVGERKVEVHLGHPGMDCTLCGLDASRDELIHEEPPEYLPKGVVYDVTCQHCIDIINAVVEHTSYGD